MKKLLIVNVGLPPKPQLDAFGKFEQWAKNVIEAHRHPKSANQAATIEFHDGINQPLPHSDHLAGVIIMGSLAMASDKEDWMLRLSQEIVHLVERSIPLLGICFGHQLIAQALGGRVGYHPQGLEIGTIAINKQPDAEHDPIFSGLPEQFDAQAVHYQSVLTLPEDAVHLASSDFEPHHAYRVGECCWGVQFHPEFTPQVMKLSLAGLQHELPDDYERKQAAVKETHHARQVLVNFAGLVEQQSQSLGAA